MKKSLVVLSLCVVVALVALGIVFSNRGYSGMVSEVKGVRSGVLIDLDGHYPNQTMTLFIPQSTLARWSESHPGWPAVGTRVRAIGPVTEYRGRPEIVITDPAQVTW